METNTALTILVWILSITLMVFLALSIFALIYMIDILKDLKKITAKAERLAESAEAMGDFFRRNAGPIAFGKFLTNVADTVLKHRQSNKRSDEK